jgi:hypothetical protein
VGEGPKKIAARSSLRENNWLNDCEANNLSGGKEEDRGSTTGKMGEAEGGEEGRVGHGAGIWPATSVAGFPFDEESLRLGCQLPWAKLATVLGCTVTLLACCGQTRSVMPHKAHRNPPARLLYQSWRCFGRDDAVPRFRAGNGTTFFLVFMQDWTASPKIRDKGLKQSHRMGPGGVFFRW